MELRYRCLDGELFSTPAAPGHFLPFAHAACDLRAQCEEFDVLSVGRLEAGWDENIDRLPESLGGRVAKHPLCGLVEERDRMLGVHGNDRVASNRKNTSELGLRAARGMLPLLARDFRQATLPNRTDAANGSHFFPGAKEIRRTEHRSEYSTSSVTVQSLWPV